MKNRQGHLEQPGGSRPCEYHWAHCIISGRTCSESHLGMIQIPHVCPLLCWKEIWHRGRRSGGRISGALLQGVGQWWGPAQGILDNCEGERGRMGNGCWVWVAYKSVFASEVPVTRRMHCLYSYLACVTWPSNQTINVQRARLSLPVLMLFLCTEHNAGHGGINLSGVLLTRGIKIKLWMNIYIWNYIPNGLLNTF